MDDFGEGLGDEAGAADERAVDVGLSHELADVFRLDGAAVEDARSFGGELAATKGELVTDDAVRFFGDVGCGCGAGTDGPHGFVGDDEAVSFGGGDVLQSDANLAADGLFGAALFAFS